MRKLCFEIKVDHSKIRNILSMALTKIIIASSGRRKFNGGRMLCISFPKPGQTDPRVFRVKSEKAKCFSANFMKCLHGNISLTLFIGGFLCNLI